MVLDIRYGDIEIIVDFETGDGVIQKDSGKTYYYPDYIIADVLDKIIPGWYSVYAQDIIEGEDIYDEFEYETNR